MKQNKTLIKELRQELHYHQMMVRVDLRAARAGVHKCKEIGAKMRALQNSQPANNGLQADVCPRCVKGVFAYDMFGLPIVCIYCNGTGKRS